MDQREELLKQFGSILVEEIKPLAKRFSDSVVAETTNKSLAIKASKYISTLVDGRRPTSAGALKGSPTLQEILLDWIKANSITPRESNMSQLALSWAMATSMHHYGDRLYQQGGGRNIFAEVLNENRFTSFASMVGDQEKRVIAESAFKKFDELKL